MQVPTIHLNGTSGEELLRQQLDAISALRDAAKTLAQAAPNPRDYYVCGPLAFPAASREHLARVIKVSEVIKELEELATAIQEAMDARAATPAPSEPGSYLPNPGAQQLPYTSDDAVRDIVAYDARLTQAERVPTADDYNEVASFAQHAMSKAR